MLDKALLALALVLGPITIEVDDDGHFRLTITFDDIDSPTENARAQLALYQAAENLCENYDADPVNVGGITVSDAEPLRGDRPALGITMEFVCALRSTE